MIGALVALLSLDMTRKLVAAGIVATTFTVTGATNATPIVLTTSAAHGIVRPVHGVVADVAGNDEANGVWVLTPTDPTHLSLSTYSRGGIPTPSVGSGSYSSGGTIQIAFPDGSILLGRRNVAMSTATATPRIVFVPTGSPAWELDPYGGVIPTSPRPRTLATQTTEQIVMKQSRQLNTERQRFEVHVTGCASPPDPDFGDFDTTQAIYQSLYGSLFDAVSPDRARVLGGSWVSQGQDIQTLDTRGQKWVGIIEIAQPVTDSPLDFIPVSTTGTFSINLVNGSSGDATVVLIPPV